MKKFLILTFLVTLLAGLFMNAPVTSIDTGNQVTYIVDNNTIDLPATPVISLQVSPNYDPPYVITCGAPDDGKIISIFKKVGAWIKGNWGYIAFFLLLISEALGLTKKIEANSILAFFWNKFVKNKAVKPL